MVNEILQGDSLEVLKTLADESVDCVVTSPPYFGLRDYGTASWKSGDIDCDHKGEIMATHRSGSNRKDENKPREIFKNVCGKCGAMREDSQIGLEETPEAYVAKLVELFRETRRVLKNEGTLWLNLGDSYVSSPIGHKTVESVFNSSTIGMKIKPDVLLGSKFDKSKMPGYKTKDLIGIPWMVAFALRKDGWYLRQDIIWAKPNPMPESVKDRCTKSHEYVFLLSKSPKYYYDNEAIKEPVKEISLKRAEYGWHGKGDDGNGNYAGLGQIEKMGTRFANPKGRNKRSVWTVTPKPFRGAHFATFPPDLIEPMILAGCPKDGIVLDPFMGAGTTAVVAKTHGRNYLGVELNESYIRIAQKRIDGVNKPLI